MIVFTGFPRSQNLSLSFSCIMFLRDHSLFTTLGIKGFGAKQGENELIPFECYFTEVILPNSY